MMPETKTSIALFIALLGLIVSIFALFGGGKMLGINDVLNFTGNGAVDLTAPELTPPENIGGIQPILPTEEYIVGGN